MCILPSTDIILIFICILWSRLSTNWDFRGWLDWITWNIDFGSSKMKPMHCGKERLPLKGTNALSCEFNSNKILRST